nr:MAG TPA: hypothetical protein [Caudoviricetes sp.]
MRRNQARRRVFNVALCARRPEPSPRMPLLRK